MTESDDIADDIGAVWGSGELEEYLDVDSGAPVTPAERLSTMTTEDRAIAVDALTMRVAALVGAMDDHQVLSLAGKAIDDLYRAGTTMQMWSPDVAAYVRGVWGTLMSSVRGRGYRVLYVINDLYPDRIGRPLELYPDLFRAVGATYLCPHWFANELPEAHDVEVTGEALAPFVEEGRRLALEQVQAAVEGREHVVYAEISGAPDTVASVVVLADRPGTVGVVRVGQPHPDNPPATAVMARG